MALFTILAALIALTSAKILTTPTITATQINDPGFGDRTNQYSFAMEEFQGSLYIGTLNAKQSNIGIVLFFLAKPFRTNGAEIWRGDEENGEWTWTQVLSGGNGNIWNFGVRKLVTVGDYLYGVTGNHVNGFELWRTNDGNNWEIVINGGFGDTENTSGRGLYAWNGYLYVGIENRQTSASLIRRAIQENGDFAVNSDWEIVTSDGFGVNANWWFADFSEFNQYLYTGTLNAASGLMLYRTLDGINWENIMVEDAVLDDDIAAMKLYTYDGRVFVGTQNWANGTSLLASTNSEGTIFKPVFTNGLFTRQNIYVWQMVEFNNRLFIGTFAFSDSFGVPFNIYSSEDPGVSDWVIETDTGFGSSNYGVRTVQVFQDTLIVGGATASVEDATRVFQAVAVAKANSTIKTSHF